MTADDLLAIARTYYPPHLSHGDSRHAASVESQRMIAARERARAERGLWNAFREKLRASHPDFGFEDTTYLHHDACFGLGMSTTPIDPSTKEWTMVRALVSVIAPLYVVYVSHMRDVDGVEESDVRYEADDESRALYTEMTRHVEATFGYARVPPELGLVRVPDVQVDPYDAGDATIYDCVFTSARR